VKTTTGRSASDGSRLDGLQHLEARHVGQAQVEHHAVVPLCAESLQRFLARRRRRDLDIGMIEQGGNA
jgi:hypothetical protein